MNIRDFKTLVANLPEVVTDEQFELIAADFATLSAARREETEDELSQTLARVAALQAKLGKQPQLVAAAQPVAPAPAPRARRTEGDFTDADLGIGDDDESGDGGEMSIGAFRAELASARASGAAKRRRLS